MTEQPETLTTEQATELKEKANVQLEKRGYSAESLSTTMGRHVKGPYHKTALP